MIHTRTNLNSFAIDTRAEHALVVLVPYDAPARARSVMRCATPLLLGHRVVILTTWRSIGQAAGAARAALTDAMIAAAVRNWDVAEQQRSGQAAEDGAALAREFGLDAVASVAQISGSWPRSIARIVDDTSVDAVLLDRANSPLRRHLVRRRGSGARPLLLLASPH